MFLRTPEKIFVLLNNYACIVLNKYVLSDDNNNVIPCKFTLKGIRRNEIACSQLHRPNLRRDKKKKLLWYNSVIPEYFLT